MQLASATPYSIKQIHTQLFHAQALLHYLDAPPSSDKAYLFSRRLSANSKDFPQLVAAFKEHGSRDLCELSPSVLHELKLKLREDAAPCIASAMENAAISKLFKDSALPADPEECLFRLEEMVLARKKHIEDMHAELETLDGAKIMVQTVADNKRAADSFKRLMSSKLGDSGNPGSVKRQRKSL